MDIINNLEDCITRIQDGKAKEVCWVWTRDFDNPDCTECRTWFPRCNKKGTSCPYECYNTEELIKITREAIEFHEACRDNSTNIG